MPSLTDPMEPILDRTLQKVLWGHPLSSFSLRCLYVLEQHYMQTHNPLEKAVHREILSRLS